jgi:hypothetical protein
VVDEAVDHGGGDDVVPEDRANRPTRLRSPNKAPCPGSLDATAGPGQSLQEAVSCREEQQFRVVRFRCVRSVPDGALWLRCGAMRIPPAGTAGSEAARALPRSAAIGPSTRRKRAASPDSQDDSRRTRTSGPPPDGEGTEGGYPPVRRVNQCPVATDQSAGNGVPRSTATGRPSGLTSPAAPLHASKGRGDVQ